MNKYTSEERKIIAEYLEHNLLVEWKTFDATREYELATILDTIEDTIKELQALTFGDIKQKLGTRFSVEGSIKGRVFMICRNLSDSNKFYVLNMDSGIVIPSSNIADHEIVEVVNE